MREPYSVNVFLYKINKGVREYLLFKRVAQPDLDLPEFWQGITGGMETGEAIEETALREIKEESGIKVSDLALSNYSYEFPIKNEWKTKYPKSATFITEHVFSAKTYEKPILSCEHNEFGWFNFKQAMDILSFEANKEALSRVEASLNA